MTQELTAIEKIAAQSRERLGNETVNALSNAINAGINANNTVTDLYQLLSNLNRISNEKGREVSSLRLVIAERDVTVAALQNKDATQQEVHTILNTTIAEQNTEIKDLKAQIIKLEKKVSKKKTTAKKKTEKEKPVEKPSEDNKPAEIEDEKWQEGKTGATTSTETAPGSTFFDEDGDLTSFEDLNGESSENNDE
jgi:uncharacterized coiled-coil protein SlyX